MGSIALDDHDPYRYDGVNEPLAIIGAATRFPDEATTTEDLWKFLLKGKSAFSPFPESRIGPGHYHPDPEHGGSFAVKGGHFLSEDPALFDAPFFKITKGEVQALDPQQRVVLENVYHALENAGLPLSKVAGSNTSVFVSGFNHDHLANLNTDPESTMKYKPTGTTNSLLSNRVSWFFDFKAPSVTLDTACSSSMVALHLGCQSLKLRESDLAVISGVTMISFPTDIMSMGHHGFLSQEGRCFSFDHRADGYARGEGVGSLIVKRLSDAIHDGNTIRAVIRGTGVNQDGQTPGISLPDSIAQESLIRRVYASAHLDFEQTAMVEAHGTGTAAGDPIEANAIARVFGSRRNTTPIYVGAIKSNIGHLEGGSGVAGIIKAMLILENGIIPPNINFEKVNPKIPMNKWRLQFPQNPVPWPTSGVRRISVNSFGVGGTNGHAILDDAYNYLGKIGVSGAHNTRQTIPSQEEVDELVCKLLPKHLAAKEQSHTPQTDGIHVNPDHKTDVTYVPRLVVLSSYDEFGVERNARRQAEFLETKYKSEDAAEPDFLVSDFAKTMSQRTQFPWKGFVQASDASQLISALKSIPKPLRVRGVPRIAFVFTGQGAQWYAMGRELLCYPQYKQSLLAAEAYMKSLGSPWMLMGEFLRDKASTELNSAHLAHPACTALQVALVDLLGSWDIQASRVVGHSSGEIAAAYAAGKLSREAAWKTAYFRGIASSMPISAKGSMMAVGLAPEAVQPYLEKVNADLEGELIIACYNSPRNVTVSGDEHKIAALKDLLAKEEIFTKKLAVKNAYHSAHMKEVADEYLRMLGDLGFASTPATADVQMYSSVTGEVIQEGVLGAAYWVRNLVSPVLFSTALHKMCFERTEKGQASIRLNASTTEVFADVLLELGPHAALQSAVKETLAQSPYGAAVTSLGVLNRSNPGLDAILNTVGQLCLRGAEVDITKVNQSTAKAREPQLLVDLPGYAFNHTEKSHIIYESRLSKNYRLRRAPRHDLFGAPVPDWNAETPRWRNVLRLNEQPWLRDHIVTSQVVLPGVSYIISAIEASRQIAAPNREIDGFRLRDVSLKRALIVPDTKDGVETMLSLSRMDESSLWASSKWRRFALSSYNPVADDWIEHCTGYITVDYQESSNPIDNGLEAEQESMAWQDTLSAVKRRCDISFSINDVYDNLVTTGLSFGPLFRNISSMHGTSTRSGEVSGIVTVPDVAESMPKNYLHPHLIHPATMDSFMHFFLSSVMDISGASTLEKPMVPTFIKDVWVSAKLNSEPGHQYHGYGKSTLLAYDKHQADVMVWDGPSEEARVSIKGIRAAPLDSVDSSEASVRKLNHTILETPYLELLSAKAFAGISRTSAEEDREYAAWVTKFQIATLLLVSDAVQDLGGKLPEGTDGHFIRYFEWMKHATSLLDQDQVSGMNRADLEAYRAEPHLKAKLYEEVAGHNADGELALRMGKNIVKVLRKEEDPLQLMFGLEDDDLLDRVYAQVAHLGDLPLLQAELLRIISDNSANLKILEIGAGTGGSTTGMLEGLAKTMADGSVSTSIGTYTFTDISTAFFEKAKEKFKDYRDYMEYKVLDIEQDPEEQGIEIGQYDIVLAQNVVHATADLKGTLSRARKLLKPGGKLLLQEGVRQDFHWSTIAFGQLPGWWAGVEPARLRSPWITSKEWDDVIQSAGFGPVDLELPDRQSRDLHTQSLFMATAISEARSSQQKWPITTIVTTSPLDAPSEIATALKKNLEQQLQLSNVQVLNYSDLANSKLDQTVCISVCELEHAILNDIDGAGFHNIRQMLCTCRGMIWATGDTEQHPELGMITGLTRTTRWERDIDEANLIILSFSEPRPQADTLARGIITLYKQQFDGALPLEKYQGEYKWENGQFYTSRLVEEDNADNFLRAQFSRPQPVDTPFKEAGRPIKLSTAAPGLLDKLEWVTDEIYPEPLADKHVEIDIKAVGMNFRDLMIAMGEHMAYSMGNEAAGIITRVGSKVTGIKPGDRVTYLCGIESTGCFHTYGRVDENVVVRIPDHMSYEVACGLPCIYATVIYGLVDAGKLGKGEKILIHAAAGGVGQAAIHFANYVGAEIYATVSTPEKRELIKSLGVADDHIFSSRDLIFVKGIMRATNGYGVDLVLNSLSGEALRESWKLLAPFGRFVEIGKKDAQASGRIELTPFLRNVTMTSVELPTMMRHRPSLIKRLTEDTVRLWTEGHIKEASPLTVMNYSQVEEGLRILQSGKGMGKMVFVPNADDVLPIVPQQLPPYTLQGDVSYLMAGGLGGIGRSCATWMARRGARHLIFLSSTGNITDSVSAMVRDLEKDCCKAHIFKCDVGDKQKLRETLDECSRILPPIKGLIQCAMKLKDVMFENMRYDDFQLAVNPKVSGSYNLHQLLPKDLDFFIMLSSATGVLGNRAQANYAAGNTFQDQLAVHRRSQGLVASTIDLGQVLGVGYVAENRDRAIVAKHLGTVLEALREDEIHALLEYLMDSRNNPPAQLVSGLTTAKLYRQRGVPQPTYLGFPLFTQLSNITTSHSTSGDGNGGILTEALLSAATTLDEAAEIVLDAVRKKLSSLLAVTVDNIEPEKSVSSNGVDSLVAMEFRTYLAKELKADVPVLEIQGTMSVRDLSRKIASVSKSVEVNEKE